MNYYNEHDPNAAAWLRELIKADLIAPGEVDERDIQDVVPSELVRFTQCHFFAGIGVWPYSLRRAGWPDDRPVWTGSCPCQPFSQAGKRGGTSDERHLWPAFFHLIRVCKPDVVFGEQVASKDGFAWLDAVHADLETASYAVGALSLPACGFGAPHRRERLFFVADSMRPGRAEGRTQSRNGQIARSGELGILADSASARSLPGTLRRVHCGEESGRSRDGEFKRYSKDGELGDSAIDGERSCDWQSKESRRSQEPVGGSGIFSELGDTSGERLEVGQLPDGRLGVVRIKGASIAETGVVRGFWEGADFILCNDEDEWKWRAVEPGSFPLANGAPVRVGRLRGYGNAIVAPVAEEFIRAYIETRGLNW